MLNNVPLLFATPALPGFAEPSDVRPSEPFTHDANRRALLESRYAQVKASSLKAGKQVLLAQFCREVDRLLQEQASIVPLLSTSPEWTRRLLLRHYFAIRSTAEILQLEQLAAIAARAEVLVGLLDAGTVQYSPLHDSVLTETASLLLGAIEDVRRDGSDSACTTAFRTAVCLYAVAEPISLTYAPSNSRSKVDAG
jgi:hypothetical protein